MFKFSRRDKYLSESSCSESSSGQSWLLTGI